MGDGMPRLNEYEQLIGDPIADTGPWPLPTGVSMVGRTCDLHRTTSAHVDGLFAAYGTALDARDWTYMPTGPGNNYEEFKDWLHTTCLGNDPLFYTIFDKEGAAIGLASYLRAKPEAGSIEVGWIAMSPLLKKTTMSTEAMYLMMCHVFDDLGYRRYEWKCDSLNAPSRACAERLGFTFEGIFRHCTHYKGRNRDTAWYSMLRTEWDAQKYRLEHYLSPTNFTPEGQQIQRLLRQGKDF